MNLLFSLPCASVSEPKEAVEPKLDVELSRLSTLEAGDNVFGTALNTHLGMLRGRASELGVVTV